MTEAVVCTCIGCTCTKTHTTHMYRKIPVRNTQRQRLLEARCTSGTSYFRSKHAFGMADGSALRQSGSSFAFRRNALASESRPHITFRPLTEQPFDTLSGISAQAVASMEATATHIHGMTWIERSECTPMLATQRHTHASKLLSTNENQVPQVCA